MKSMTFTILILISTLSFAEGPGGAGGGGIHPGDVPFPLDWRFVACYDQAMNTPDSVGRYADWRPERIADCGSLWGDVPDERRAG